MEMMENTPSNGVWDFVWQTFENASLTYDLVSSQNATKANPEDSFPFENPAKLGILTGFVIACLVDFRIATPKFQVDACLEENLRTMATTFTKIISFLLLVPLVTPILMILFVYRKIVETVVKIQLGDDFVGLLEGTDCVWALEESSALSVINVIGVLEKNCGALNENFLLDFRTLIKERLLSSNFDKLNWLREKKYGYFYWRKNEGVRLEERVRWIDEGDDHVGCDGTCDDVNGNFLKTVYTRATNKPLPRAHSTSWEILVCRTCAKSSSKRLQEMEEGLIGLDNESTGRKTTIPLLFRVHHSLADGVALLRLLLESIADSDSLRVDKDNPQTSSTSSIDIAKGIETPRPEKRNDLRELRVPLLRKSSSILGTLREEDEVLYYANDLLSASMPFTARFLLHGIVASIIRGIDNGCKLINGLTVDDVKQKMIIVISNSLTTLRVNYLERLRMMLTKAGEFLAVLISIPSCLVQQALRSMDNSALHGPGLTGEKILAFWIESDDKNTNNSNLMSKIRDIKKATGTRFADVILAALSANLHRYFLKIGESSPKSMNVVIPARMTKPSQKLSLQNEFSVGLQTLCISEVNGESVENDNPKDFRLWERLGDVSRSSEKLRKGSDYLINFWVMKWLSAALPECLLKPVLESHSTLVFSNLPGPQEVTILGYKLKNVAFWIPHRGSTGIGCSFLTYGSKVHFSLVADSAVVRSQQLLDNILCDTVENIEKLHENLTLSCYSLHLRDRSEAPMETGLGVRRMNDR